MGSQPEMGQERPARKGRQSWWRACLAAPDMELQTDEDPEKGSLRREMEKVTTRQNCGGWGEKGQSYKVHVPEQELTKQEEQAYLRAAEEELIKEFPGDNESVNCIRDACCHS